MTLKKILLVEDEMIVAEDIAGRLTKLGYAVSEIVSSGEAAIKACQENRPDLVIMDIVLKGSMDGIEAAQYIRNFFGVPVVYLTAYADKETLERAKITEPFGYILKPFKENDLYATIEISLQRHEVEVKMSQALNSSEELRQFVREKEQRTNQYVSMAAHELRRPLSAILLSADSLRLHRERWDEETKLKYLYWIQSAAENMDRLIEDMLFIGKAEGGKLSFNPERVELEQFCRQIVEQQRSLCLDSHKLIFTSENTDITACLDPTLLRLILSNLLSNAIKYSPDGGEVRLEAKIDRSDGDGQFSFLSLPIVIFRVRDRGIGIPPEEQGNKLFDLFHRCENVGKIQGNGLGLAIVKKAVDLHQGAIAVESEVKIGTTFTVALPFTVNKMAN